MTTAAAGQPPSLTSRGRQRPVLSLISAKMLMAITGTGLLLFVIMHMLGNLQIFIGQDAINAYAAMLKGMPVLLWIARIGLLATFVGHVMLAFYLRRINRRARPMSYAINDPIDTTFASRTMLLSGLVIFAFLIYHLLHFTLGVTDPATHQLTDAQGRHDVYSMVVASFRNVYVSAAYIAAMVFLGLHLSHAASSIFQTVGLAGQRSRLYIHRAAVALAVIITLGNMSIPVAVLTGLLGLASDGGQP